MNFSLLAASLGWVLRWWKVEGLCQGADWEPRYPFQGLPRNLVEVIWAASEALRKGGGISPRASPPWWSHPPRVEVTDAADHVRAVVSEARELQRVIDANPDDNSWDADHDVFTIWDRLEWHCSQIPVSGFETCEADVVFQDGAVCDTSAHAAVHRLREAIHHTLGFAALGTRADPRCSGLNPWFVPYWTPTTRLGVVGRLPKLHGAKWIAQLEIEQRKLRRGIHSPVITSSPHSPATFAPGGGTNWPVAPGQRVVSVTDHDNVRHAIDLFVCRYLGLVALPTHPTHDWPQRYGVWLAGRLNAGTPLEIWQNARGTYLVVSATANEGIAVNGDQFGDLQPALVTTSTTPAPGSTNAAWSRTSVALPRVDGPFGADGFRYGETEIRFGRAILQFRLVQALWNGKQSRPSTQRPVADVIAEVYGDENDTTDEAFRVLCTEVRKRFDKYNVPLTVSTVQHQVLLAPRPV